MKKFFTLFFVAALTATFIILVDKYLLPTSTYNITEQVKVIDQKLNQLNADIQQLRIAKINAQTEAQALLPVEWEAYAKKIEEVEKNETALESLEKEVKELSLKKDALESKKSPATNKL